MTPNDELPLATSADQILGASDLPTEDVRCPEWGVMVRIRGLTGEGRDEYEASTLIWRDGKAYPDTANARAKLVARCVVNGEGEPMFTQQDVDKLGRKSAIALDRVWDRCVKLSGLSEEDLAELAGNSGADPSGDSTSTSPNGSGAPLVNSSDVSAPAS